MSSGPAVARIVRHNPPRCSIRSIDSDASQSRGLWSHRAPADGYLVAPNARCSRRGIAPAAQPSGVEVMNHASRPRILEFRPRTTTPPLLRIRRTGLGHSVGAGFRVSSIRKSPFASSGTPVRAVLRWTKGAVASQIRVAKTLWLAFCPMLLPLASSRPRPSYPDVPVLVHVGSEVGDPPGSGAGADSSHDVELHVRECSIGVRRPGAVRHRNDTYATVESRQRVTPMRTRRSDQPCRGPGESTLPASSCPALSLF